MVETRLGVKKKSAEEVKELPPVPSRNDDEVNSGGDEEEDLEEESSVKKKSAEEVKEQPPVPSRNDDEVNSGGDDEEDLEEESNRFPIGNDESDRSPAHDDVVAEVDTGTGGDEEEDLEEETERTEEKGDIDEESTSRTLTESNGLEDEIEPALQPLRMCFPPSEYKKKIKLATRCYIIEALETLDGLTHPLTTFERKWFEEHESFKHIFHMPREKNHKVMGMWMLLLRKACIEKRKEAWFVVNGVPIRYGIREHALISGFNCRNYPVNYKKAGSEAFVKRHFKGMKRIRYQDVKAKLLNMVPVGRSTDRLKMAVLYFLSSIVIAQTKTGIDATPVESLFLRAVDDLEFCKDFPWGRLSFDHMLHSIEHTMSHFKGTVKEGALWPIPGFCIPMELLAFEAIPELGEQFLEEYPDADENCPRMCRKRFKKCERKGIPLSGIYKALGTTVDIDSIVVGRDEEKSLLATITEKEDDDDEHDVVVNSWMQWIGKGVTILLDNMYIDDVATRVEEEPPEDAGNEEISSNETPGNPTFEEFAKLVDIVQNMKAEMGSQLERIEEKYDGFEKRLGVLEASHKELRDNLKAHSGGSTNLEGVHHEDTASSTNPPEAVKEQEKRGVKRRQPDCERVLRSRK